MSARGRIAAAALVLAGVATTSGCGIDTAVTEAAGNLVETGLETAVGRIAAEELRQAGVPIDGAPDCSADVDIGGGKVSGSCLGRTTSGQAVDAVFEGSVESGACSVLLVVSVDGTEVSRTDNAVPCQFA